MFLGGWFGGAGVSVNLVVEERDKDEEMGDKSIIFYSIFFVVYIILQTKCSYKTNYSLRLQTTLIKWHV